MDLHPNGGRLLTLDPGNGCTGAALFQAGELRAAWALCADLEVLPCLACPLCRTGASCQHQVHRCAPSWPACPSCTRWTSAPSRPRPTGRAPRTWSACSPWPAPLASSWARCPADFAELVEPAPVRGRKRATTTTTGKGKGKGRAPVQGGFTFATGPGGTPAALHADDVDGLLDLERDR